MTTLKIKYSEKRRKFCFVFSMVWFFLILAQFLASKQVHWFDYIMPILGFLTTFFYALQYYCPYLIIQNGMLMTELPFGKKIFLNDVIQIKSFAGDIILKGKYNEVRIITELMDPNEVARLKEELKKLNVAWIA